MFCFTSVTRLIILILHLWPLSHCSKGLFYDHDIMKWKRHRRAWESSCFIPSRQICSTKQPPMTMAPILTQEVMRSIALLKQIKGELPTWKFSTKHLLKGFTTMSEMGKNYSVVYVYKSYCMGIRKRKMETRIYAHRRKQWNKKELYWLRDTLCSTHTVITWWVRWSFKIKRQTSEPRDKRQIYSQIPKENIKKMI